MAIGRDLGWNTIRSDRFEVRAVNGHLLFEGSGSGNGIGLCQLGAEAMGGAGKSCHEILSFYYPGTTLGLNGQGLQWQRLAGESITLLTTRPDSDRIALTTAERLARSLTQRTGWPAPPGTELRVWPDLDTFRNATSEPGWVAAWTTGHTIDLQPVASLRNRGLLESTLSHELLHILMASEAEPGLPLWFREGLTDALENPRAEGPAAVPAEADLRQTSDPARARRAYAQAHAEVARLIRAYGETTVIGWVSRGLPPEVIKASTSHAPPNSR